MIVHFLVMNSKRCICNVCQETMNLRRAFCRLVSNVGFFMNQIPNTNEPHQKIYLPNIWFGSLAHENFEF